MLCHASTQTQVRDSSSTLSCVQQRTCSLLLGQQHRQRCMLISERQLGQEMLPIERARAHLTRSAFFATGTACKDVVQSCQPCCRGRRQSVGQRGIVQQPSHLLHTTQPARSVADCKQPVRRSRAAARVHSRQIQTRSIDPHVGAGASLPCLRQGAPAALLCRAAAFEGSELGSNALPVMPVSHCPCQAT